MLVGDLDITSVFSRVRTQIVGDLCVITYQGSYLVSPDDNGKLLVIMSGNVSD